MTFFSSTTQKNIRCSSFFNYGHQHFFLRTLIAGDVRYVCARGYATFFFRGIIVSFSIENVGAVGRSGLGDGIFFLSFLSSCGDGGRRRLVTFDNAGGREKQNDTATKNKENYVSIAQDFCCRCCCLCILARSGPGHKAYSA